jgi:hypothetical protein
MEPFYKSPEIVNDVMKLLYKLNDERRKILFGDTSRFIYWLKEHNVVDRVKFKIILICLK